LKGVGKSTLEMYNEFIVTGKINRLEEMRPEEEED
jgi:DNA polymerase/3'-5' exonuclease PolX